MVTWILRIESVAVFAAGVVTYLALGGPLILLLPALLAPDLSAVGYLAGPRVGAIIYNAVHNFALAVLLLAAGWVIETPWLAPAGAIVAAHVGMDRALGYGLKLASGFGDTHLGRIGRRRGAS